MTGEAVGQRLICDGVASTRERSLRCISCPDHQAQTSSQSASGDQPNQSVPLIHRGANNRTRSLKQMFTCAELYSGEMYSHGNLANSSLLDQKFVQDLRQV